MFTEGVFMRYVISIFMIGLLVGCAGVPPKPPTFKGEYRPINKVNVVTNTHEAAIHRIFDFNYEGDIVGSLIALHAVQPQLDIMPPLGKVSPLFVRVHLRGTNLENALRAIGEQGKQVAEVVWNTAQTHGANQAFIQFRAPYQQSRDTHSQGTNSRGNV
jgi:hypothetical protein